MMNADQTVPRSGEAAQPALTALLRSPERLAAVQRSGLLDSPPEEAFDALTRLAALLLKAPASFISIVDAERDFYKSQIGFPDTLAHQRQLTGRTFCHHALAQAEPLVIDDTQAHQEWQAVPTVTSMGVRAYVGVPVRLDGQTIGSLCVIDHQPRAWTATELAIITQLAMSASRELGLRDVARRANEEAARARGMVLSKEKVLAIVIHDLRTPLQIIGLGAGQLHSAGDPAQSVLAGRMLRAIGVMRSLIDNLVHESLSDAAAGPRRERMGAQALMCDVFDTMELVATRAGVALELGSLPEVDLTVDYAQMLRVFGNLIGNSIKYCPPGTTVVLAGGLDGDTVWLSVSDNGPGMSAEDQGRAFEAGWQGGDGLARGDGSGLGLSIVNTLVEANGGRVAINSRLGQGTTVTVRLRRQSPARL